jgi:hypothetical protein
MDDSELILWIQALVDAKIAIKSVIHTPPHSDFSPNIEEVAHRYIIYSL